VVEAVLVSLEYQTSMKVALRRKSDLNWTKDRYNWFDLTCHHYSLMNSAGSSHGLYVYKQFEKISHIGTSLGNTSFNGFWYFYVVVFICIVDFS